MNWCVGCVFGSGGDEPMMVLSLRRKKTLSSLKICCQQGDLKRLQQETLFLGVGLLYRFLSNGFFKTERNLQIVGIACLVLATRLEENQPYNSVLKKNFSVGMKIYSRCEVVAMEWLVQEVLNFQCLLPTIYNFLWFYLKAARADAEEEKMARYLAVLALSDPSCYAIGPQQLQLGLLYWLL